LNFADAGLSGRIAQIEPMGREILYVVDTDIGYVRVLEHGSAAAHTAGEPVNIDFSPGDSLVFDSATERLIAGARAHPPDDQPMTALSLPFPASGGKGEGRAVS
jgi:inositol-phosphate transport system ATP-binding protein